MIFSTYRICLVCSAVLAISLASSSSSHSDEKRENDKKGKGYFGSKTPYDLRYTDWASVAKAEKLPSTCQLIHLRFVARHGTRTMDVEKVEGVLKAIAAISNAMANGSNKKKNLSREALDKIISWKNQLPTDKELLDRGKAEHRFLANNVYNLMKTSPALSQATSFRFEATSKSRSQQSAEAFKGELYRLLGRPIDQPAIPVNDKLLYYHKNCTAFQTRVSKNDTCMAEATRANGTKDAKDVIKEVNRKKLGLETNALKWEDIFALYELAGFELAALNSSVFTPLFGKDELAYLEYADDLEQYWTKAYSRDPVTRDMSCVLTNDIFATAQEAYKQRRSGSDSTITVENGFGFAHLETLLPIYGAFGLFHDPERSFVADADDHFYSKRKYDTSEIGKMASNILFLFYDCPNAEEPRDKLVMMLVNGIPQSLPRACPKNSLCPLKTIQDAYPIVTGYPKPCAFDEICALNSAPVPQPTTPSLVRKRRNYF